MIDGNSIIQLFWALGIAIAIALIIGLSDLLTGDPDAKEKREKREWQDYKNRHNCTLIEIDNTTGKSKWQRADGVIIVNEFKE